MEREEIETLFERLNEQKEYPFPKAGVPLVVSDKPGVYVIRDEARKVVHVGRTVRGRGGLKQRLNNHLRGQSSFVKDSHLNGDGSRLRGVYTFQVLSVDDSRQRALLECLAIARLCPEHLGLGALRDKNGRG